MELLFDVTVPPKWCLKLEMPLDHLQPMPLWREIGEMTMCCASNSTPF